MTKHTNRSIEYITEKIHCNKEIFPEYTNVYIRGYKSPFAVVSNGRKFQYKPQKRIIDQIIENSMIMLQDYVDFDENIEKIGLAIIDKYEKYANLVEMDGRDLENGPDYENVNNWSCLLLFDSDSLHLVEHIEFSFLNEILIKVNWHNFVCRVDIDIFHPFFYI
jgi:hypothetical protein